MSNVRFFVRVCSEFDWDFVSWMCVLALERVALFAEVRTANYRLRELNSKCPKAMESYTKCMDYYSNEFDMCRKEQQEFEASCPL